MAGKFGSVSVMFLVDGYNLLSAKLKGLRYKVMAKTEPTDGLGDAPEAHTPTGMSGFELAQEGAFFDTSSGSSHDALSGSIPSSPQASTRVVVAGMAGNTIGEPFLGFSGLFSHAYEVLAQIGTLQKANADYKVTGAVERGVILHALGAETAAGNTEASSVDHAAEPQQVIPITSNSIANPTVVTTTVAHGLTTGDTVVIAGVATSDPTINGEQTVTVVSTTTFTVPVNVTTGGTGGTLTRGKTNAGGAGYLEVTAVTLGGYDNAVIKVRDSDDDITFADLVTFTAVTARTAERVAVAGVVERYLAQSIALTGAGSGPSFTYFVGFARN